MGVPFAIASTLYQGYASNKALEAQGRANRQTARNYITSMNYNLQSLEQSRRDAFDATIDDLEKNSLQGHRQEAGVAAAVNEGLMGGGRTANLLKRSSAADTNRALTSIKDNYRRKSNEIDLNREATVRNTRSSISSIQDVEKPSLLSTLVSLGTAYVGARTAYESVDAIRHNAGVTDRHDENKNNWYHTYPNVGDNWKTDNWNSMFSKYWNTNSSVPSTFSYVNPFDQYTQDKQQVNYFDMK